MQIIAWAMGLTVKKPPNLEVFLLVNCVHGDTLLPKLGVYSVFATTGSLYPDLMIGVKLSLTWLLPSIGCAVHTPSSRREVGSDDSEEGGL